jgi:hypothetical protein
MRDIYEERWREITSPSLHVVNSLLHANHVMLINVLQNARHVHVLHELHAYGHISEK